MLGWGLKSSVLLHHRPVIDGLQAEHFLPPPCMLFAPMPQDIDAWILLGYYVCCNMWPDFSYWTYTTSFVFYESVKPDMGHILYWTSGRLTGTSDRNVNRQQSLVLETFWEGNFFKGMFCPGTLVKEYCVRKHFVGAPIFLPEQLLSSLAGSSGAWTGWQAVGPGLAGRQQGLDRLAGSWAWLVWQAGRTWIGWQAAGPG